MLVVGLHGYKCSAAANGFHVEIDVFLADLVLGQLADDTTRGRTRSGAGSSTRRCGNQPARRNHRSYARNGQHAKTGQQTCAAAQNGTCSGACTRAFGGRVFVSGVVALVGIVGLPLLAY